jgi:signal transduction histidine kinase
MICYLYPEPSYFFLVPDLSLVYYSHIPVAFLALLVGFFVFLNGRKYLANQLLVLIVLSFALWNVINMISWTNIHSDVILFAWSFYGPLSALISVLSVYFMYAYLRKTDVGMRIKGIFLALLAPVFLLAPTSLSLTGFNITNCDAFGFEVSAFEAYYYALGIVAMLWILGLLFYHYHKASAEMRKQILLLGMGIELFLFSFFFTGYLASLLTQAGLLPDSGIEIYGLFGMVIFMVYIAILLVRYKAFHSSILAARALVVGLIVLIGAEFAFTRSTVNLVLVSITLVLTGVLGIILLRSVRREIEQREHIELLAKDLEKANQQQIILIHFITHQIKGFVAKSRNIFAGLKEGDYGAVPATMMPLIEEGFRSDTKGAQTIQEILNAANIKSGKVTYSKEVLDLKSLLESVISDLNPFAVKKGLVLNTDLAAISYTGDRMQLINAFKNLIDNSIKYTPSGTVSISLSQIKGSIRFELKDTGVGISEDDMKNLFTEGGRGKDSQKVNVESTGFGLYIVKNIIEAHGGKVWAESEGTGKGARFIVELPA